MKIKLRKMSAFLLVLCLMLQSISYAQSESDDLSQEIVPELEALTVMQLLTEDVNLLSQIDNVTRSMFVGNMFNIAGFSYSVSEMGNNPFSDVTDDTLYKNEILTFYNMGLINGTGVNTFSPEKLITYGQAIKISLDVLGYSEYVKAKYNGSIDGYVLTASRIDLTDRMRISNYNNPITVRDMAILLYNAGITPVYEVSSVTKGDTGLMQNYNAGKILFSNRDIYYKEGIVQSNGLVNTDGTDPDVDFAVIGGKKYKLNDTDITSLLGYNVKYFYNDNNGVPILLWAYPTDNNEVLVIDSEDLNVDDSRYSRECIVYTDAKKREIARIDTYATVIYNNTLYNGFTVEHIKPNSGKIRLIDINRDKKYDTVIVEEFGNIFVTTVAKNETFVADKFGHSLYFEDYDNVKIIKDGKFISVKEIPLNVIVSYIESLDKKHLYLYVNGEGNTSALEAISDDGEDKFFYFEDKEYKVAHSYLNLGSNYTAITPVIGTVYKYYLDMSGEIAHFEEAAGGRIQYAYLLKCAPDDAPFAKQGKAIFRVMLSDGTKADVKSKDKLILNGIKGCNGTDILNYISNNSIQLPIVVKMAFDADSDIKEIQFAQPITNPYGYDKDNFTLDFESTSSTFGPDNVYMVEQKYSITSKTICFVTNTDTNDPEPYEVINYNDIYDSNYNVKLYDCDESLEPAAISLVRSQQSRGLDGLVLVDKVRHVVIEGESFKQIEGINKNNRVKYTELENGCIPDDIKRGDIVRLSVYNSRVTKVNVLTRLSDKPEPFITDFGQKTCYIFGPLYARGESTIVTLNPPEHANGLLTGTSTSKNRYFYVSVYDYKNDCVYPGDHNDLYQISEPDSLGDLPQSDNNVYCFIQRRYNYVIEVVVVYY